MGIGFANDFGTGVRIAALVAGLAATQADAKCLPGSIETRSESGAVARFSIEVADDDAERAQGLMNRPSLPKSSGMLFIYQRPHHAFFWMKNTLIPLDMIFADATGLVTAVHEHAVPLDETSIDGGEGVTYVLEINAGLSSALGLKPGAHLRADLIAQDQAVWSCAE
jgi:uncharacterized membrane protein (UPF0127 family)